jgi:hypothetical protein
VSVFLKDLTTALNKSKLNTDEKEQIKIKQKQNSSACYRRLLIG